MDKFKSRSFIRIYNPREGPTMKLRTRLRCFNRTIRINFFNNSNMTISTINASLTATKHNNIANVTRRTIYPISKFSSSQSPHPAVSHIGTNRKTKLMPTNINPPSALAKLICIPRITRTMIWIKSSRQRINV